MRKFSRLTKHRMSMWRTMSCQLIQHGQIETTLQKAKDLRSFVEKLITKAKVFYGDNSKKIHIHRLLLSRLHHQEKIVKILIEEIAPLFKERNGGYTRIIRNGFRAGDKGDKVYIQIIKS